MQQTYQEAINQVFQDEGGYSNDAGDPGGPTNWGITIEDARMYWKSDATASDVKDMPKTVAEEIYVKHYANPLHYDDLPPGVDYAVLDYGINSGISRSAKVLQRIVGTNVDGVMGPLTVEATRNRDVSQTIDQIYEERLSFLQSLSTWRLFGKGWASRCQRGRLLAHTLYNKYHTSNAKAPETTPVIKPATPAPTQVKTQSWLASLLNFLLSLIKGK